MSTPTTVRQERHIIIETYQVCAWTINIWANYFARGAGSFTAAGTHPTHAPVSATRFTPRAALHACLLAMPKEPNHDQKTERPNDTLHDQRHAN